MPSVVDAVFGMHQMRLDREADTEGWMEKKMTDLFNKDDLHARLKQRLKEYGELYVKWFKQDEEYLTANQLNSDGTHKTKKDALREDLDKKLSRIKSWIEKNTMSGENIQAILNANAEDFFNAASSYVTNDNDKTFPNVFANAALSPEFKARLDQMKKMTSTSVWFSFVNQAHQEKFKPYDTSTKSLDNLKLMGYRFGSDLRTLAIFFGEDDEVVQKARTLYSGAEAKIKRWQKEASERPQEVHDEFRRMIDERDQTGRDKIFTTMLPFQYSENGQSFRREVQSKIVVNYTEGGNFQVYPKVELKDTRFSTGVFYPLHPIYVHSPSLAPTNISTAPAAPQQPQAVLMPPPGAAGPSGAAGGAAAEQEVEEEVEEELEAEAAVDEEEAANGNANNADGDVNMAERAEPAPAEDSFFNPIGSRTRRATRIEEEMRNQGR
jgi:hypothetical protein